jgi:triacylglycerol lipase
MLALADFLSARFLHVPPYDFKLDQWGISRAQSESDWAYRGRVLESPIWHQADISIWDLRPAGAAALNVEFPAVASVYYFSWAASDSFMGPLGIGHLPRSGMNPALIPASLAIGNYLNTGDVASFRVFDESWWPNDGAVNTRSMRGPNLGSSDLIIVRSEQGPESETRPGIWYFMGTRSGWDHLDMVGLQTRKNYRAFYLQLARQLAELPPAANDGA